MALENEQVLFGIDCCPLPQMQPLNMWAATHEGLLPIKGVNRYGATKHFFNDIATINSNGQAPKKLPVQQILEVITRIP